MSADPHSAAHRSFANGPDGLDGPDGPALPAGRVPRPRRSLRRAWRHSLKARLVTLFLLLALGTTALFLWGVREPFATGWRELARPLVADYVDRLAAEIGSPPDIDRALALTRRLPLSVRIDGPLVNWSSPGALRPDSRPRRFIHNDSHNDRQNASQIASHANAGDERWDSLLSRSTADGHRIRFGAGDWRWDDQPGGLGWGVLAGLLALTALAYVVVRRLFRPIDDIRAGALRYGEGNFAQSIPVRRQDELGELATQVNTMASSLQRMLEGQRGLLLAISHELRSPLTRARLHAELLAEGAERMALLRDLGQMRDLISDLLEGERLAAGAAALQREATDLNALVRDLVEAQFAGRDITLSLDSALPTLALDRSRLQLLVRNLLDNALRHGAGTPVALHTGLTDAGVCLRVRDLGPGVAPAQLPHLTEAFYRPDEARSRSAGGVGLGLYLCRLVAESHGGSLRLRNAQPGLEISLCLPLKPGAAGVAGVIARCRRTRPPDRS